MKQMRIVPLALVALAAVLSTGVNGCPTTTPPPPFGQTYTVTFNGVAVPPGPIIGGNGGIVRSDGAKIESAVAEIEFDREDLEGRIFVVDLIQARKNAKSSEEIIALFLIAAGAFIDLQGTEYHFPYFEGGPNSGEVFVPFGHGVRSCVVTLHLSNSHGRGDKLISFVSAEADELDFDHDGLPDEWESCAGLNPNDPTGDWGNTGDPDNDGMTNWQEFIRWQRPVNWVNCNTSGPIVPSPTDPDDVILPTLAIDLSLTQADSTDSSVRVGEELLFKSNPTGVVGNGHFSWKIDGQITPFTTVNIGIHFNVAGSHTVEVTATDDREIPTPRTDSLTVVVLAVDEPDPLEVSLALIESNPDGRIEVGENILIIATPTHVVGATRDYGWQINGGAPIAGRTSNTFSWVFSSATHKVVKVTATDSRGVPATAEIAFDVVEDDNPTPPTIDITSPTPPANGNNVFHPGNVVTLTAVLGGTIPANTFVDWFMPWTGPNDPDILGLSTSTTVPDLIGSGYLYVFLRASDGTVLSSDRVWIQVDPTGKSFTVQF